MLSLLFGEGNLFNLANLDIGSLGSTGVLTIVVLIIVFGLLVPRRTLNDSRKQYIAQLKDVTQERDEWKAAFFASDKTVRELSGQLALAVETGRTTEAAIKAIPQVIPREAGNNET